MKIKFINIGLCLIFFLNIFEYYIFYNYKQNKLFPIFKEDFYLELNNYYKYIYYFILLLLLLFIASRINIKKQFKLGKIFIIIELFIWLFKYFIFRNYYYTSDILKIIELPNYLMINVDLISLLMRMVLILIIFDKINIKNIIIVSLLSVFIIKLKTIYFIFPFFYIDWL